MVDTEGSQVGLAWEESTAWHTVNWWPPATSASVLWLHFPRLLPANGAPWGCYCWHSCRIPHKGNYGLRTPQQKGHNIFRTVLCPGILPVQVFLPSLFKAIRPESRSESPSTHFCSLPPYPSQALLLRSFFFLMSDSLMPSCSLLLRGPELTWCCWNWVTHSPGY